MDEQLYNMIFKRKSFHLFRNMGNVKITTEEIDHILEYCQSLTPLYKEIKTAVNIVPTQETTCKRGQESQSRE